MSTYMKLSDPLYDFLTKEIQKTYKNACICWIEIVENKNLTEAYEKYKSSLKEPNEKLLYHGTSENIINRIIAEGFRPELNTTSLYGNGVYFSTRAVYSKYYSIMKSSLTKNDLAFMLVSNVCVGLSTNGASNKDIPYGYNSFTDNINNPDMYIVNKKEACNPRYIIAFYPYAQ